ncbi:PREDICTED: mammaglobin-A-like [Dipodomys ordii]|uniref:Mammaglobin-A-like n=1 Tax=Dipodomys ordii TaxID=10020 RepID=A0A1S3G6X2_DIPOR|nr:PREDICTED: mammaglobin-A-like [Dipodomys ordii]
MTFEADPCLWKFSSAPDFHTVAGTPSSFSSGCEKLEYLLNVTIAPEVSVDEYQKIMSPYVSTSTANDAVGELKECFLKQSNETLANVKVMLTHIYNSVSCDPY